MYPEKPVIHHMMLAIEYMVRGPALSPFPGLLSVVAQTCGGEETCITMFPGLLT